MIRTTIAIWAGLTKAAQDDLTRLVSEQKVTGEEMGQLYVKGLVDSLGKLTELGFDVFMGRKTDMLVNA